MTRRVVFSPEAEDQLVALYRYIADAASPEIAARYTEAIVSYCEPFLTAVPSAMTSARGFALRTTKSGP